MERNAFIMRRGQGDMTPGIEGMTVEDINGMIGIGTIQRERPKSIRKVAIASTLATTQEKTLIALMKATTNQSAARFHLDLQYQSHRLSKPVASKDLSMPPIRNRITLQK
jgi:hypothetical protein